MKTQVSFQRDSSTLGSDSPPYGRDIVDWLIEGLRQRGVACDQDGGLEYAFDFHAAVGKHSFYVMLGLVNDGVRQWLISTNSNVGFIGRLLRLTDAHEHLELVNHIDSLLQNDDGISSIRWYTLDEWNIAPDDTWGEHPVA